MNNILPKTHELYEKSIKTDIKVKYQFIPNDKKSINELYATLFGRLLRKS